METGVAPPPPLTPSPLDLPRLPIPLVAAAVAQHLNEPARLRAVLARLTAANAASAAVAHSLWSSEEEGEGGAAAGAAWHTSGPAAGATAVGGGCLAPTPAAASLPGDTAFPIAMLPARIVWADSVRASGREGPAGAAGCRGPAPPAGAIGGVCGGLARVGAGAWALLLWSLGDEGLWAKGPPEEGGGEWWLLLRAMVLGALALLWLLAL